MEPILSCAHPPIAHFSLKAGFASKQPLELLFEGTPAGKPLFGFEVFQFGPFLVGAANKNSQFFLQAHTVDGRKAFRTT